MNQLEEMKARADGLAQVTTDDLAMMLNEYGEEYKLLAQVEVDHRRLIAALEATLRFLDKLDRLDADLGTEQGEDNISASGVAIIMRRSITEALQ